MKLLCGHESRSEKGVMSKAKYLRCDQSDSCLQIPYCSKLCTVFTLCLLCTLCLQLCALYCVWEGDFVLGTKLHMLSLRLLLWVLKGLPQKQLLAGFVATLPSLYIQKGNLLGLGIWPHMEARHVRYFPDGANFPLGVQISHVMQWT